MKKVLTNKAITLLELIISSVLVIIVILGTFAVSNVLNNNTQDYGIRYLVKSATQLTLNNILNSATLAVGSRLNNDSPILIGGSCTPVGAPTSCGNLGVEDQVNNPNTICIHQNQGLDSWQCYTYYPQGVTNQYQIFSCSPKYDSTLFPLRGATSCSNPSNPNPSIYVGTARALPNWSYTLGGAFSLSIANCFDNTNQLTCNQSPSNPVVTLNGSVIPPQVSS